MWPIIISTILTVGAFVLAIYLTDNDTYIFIAGVITFVVVAILTLGLWCGCVSQSTHVRYLKPGEFDFGKSQSKYFINYSYNNPSLQTGEFIGTDYKTYKSLSDSSVLKLIIDVNAYGHDLTTVFQVLTPEQYRNETLSDQAQIKSPLR